MRPVILVLLLMVFLLSGCDSVELLSGGSYFALPRRSDEYEKLGVAIEKEMQDADYSPPTLGYNRQAIQMEDLDGDGEREAVVFLSSKSGGLLRLLIFRKTGEEYELSAYTDVEGTAFDSIWYDDLSGNGKVDIVVGSSLGSGLLKALTVYSYEMGGLLPLLTNTYTGYTIFDINGDGKRELILARHDVTTLSGVVEVYRKTAETKGLTLDSVAELSQDIEALRRMRTGMLIGDRPAVFIAGAVSKSGKGGIITDIFAYNQGEFQNITADENTGVSDGTIRQYNIYATDLTGNGLLEIPRIVELAALDDASGEIYFKNVWKNYDADGKYVEVMETYHNYTDGWYFILPESMREGLVLERRDLFGGERSTVFYIKFPGSQPPIEILSIYTLTGDNREERAEVGGRFRLPQSRQDAVFAATLTSAAGSLKIDAETVSKNFKLIQTEWTAGEITS